MEGVQCMFVVLQCKHNGPFLVLIIDEPFSVAPAGGVIAVPLEIINQMDNYNMYFDTNWIWKAIINKGRKETKVIALAYNM